MPNKSEKRFIGADHSANQTKQSLHQPVATDIQHIIFYQVGDDNIITMTKRLAILFFALASFLHSSLTAAESVPPKSVSDDAAASGDDSCLDASSDDNKSSVYVIGDIHGDVLCAISWVHRTGLIENLLDASNNSDDSATDVCTKSSTAPPNGNGMTIKPN